jgi:hypothetical protein
VESVRVARHDDEHGQSAHAVEGVEVAAASRLLGDDVAERVPISMPEIGDPLKNSN